MAASRREFEAKIVAKAWSDADFRKKLESDPKGTLQQELKAHYPDLSLPEDLKVSLFTESADEICIVLPPGPSETSMSDEELGAVAGGTGVAVVVAAAVAAVAGGVVDVVANVNLDVNIDVNVNVNVGVNVSTSG